MFGLITYNLDLLILDLHSDLLNPLWYDLSMLILNPLFYKLILQFAFSAKSPLLELINAPILHKFLQHFMNLNKSTNLHHGALPSLYRYLWLRVRYESMAKIHPSYCCLTVFMPNSFHFSDWLHVDHIGNQNRFVFIFTSSRSIHMLAQK